MRTEQQKGKINGLMAGRQVRLGNLNNFNLPSLFPLLNQTLSLTWEGRLEYSALEYNDTIEIRENESSHQYESRI